MMNMFNKLFKLALPQARKIELATIGVLHCGISQAPRHQCLAAIRTSYFNYVQHATTQIILHGFVVFLCLVTPLEILLDRDDDGFLY